MDLGAGRRGVDMGPSAIRIAGLAQRLAAVGIQVSDAGNLSVKIPEEINCGLENQMYLSEIAEVCGELSRQVFSVIDGGEFPIVIGGDHSLAAGSVSGTAAFFRRQREKIGLIWIDAHTDVNTPETSPSGNVHGMPLAALLGQGPAELSTLAGFAPKVDAQNAVVVGARRIDPREKEMIQQLGLRVITMKELDRRGLGAVMDEALSIATKNTLGFHCSFDLDVIDPVVAPGVGTPVPGGMTYRESHLAMEMIHESFKILALEMVELNPVLDERNISGRLGVELICSALGQTIL
jgi:arginase